MPLKKWSGGFNEDVDSALPLITIDMFGLSLQAAFLMQYYGDVNKYNCG